MQKVRRAIQLILAEGWKPAVADHAAKHRDERTNRIGPLYVGDYDSEVRVQQGLTGDMYRTRGMV
jgi:hypothetical protein